ncbi:MAG: class I SAM-dependent methyltransferase [Alphaproteobacteria bacterium]|nr:class I SAM-dependent methyltransferase [Alphaproteobacteria bacterium]
MTPLARIISDEIEKAGPISVSRFMELALGHPRYGYYMNRDPLGAKGDFITAPEVSQMMGEIIGLWAVVVWQAMGTPNPFVLAELGPGRGTLMADALRAGAIKAGFVEAARVHLVETSPLLRARQADVLGIFEPTFLDTAMDLPPGPMIVIANEFFDALPVRQLVATKDGWVERCVNSLPGTDGGFTFTTSAPLETPLVPPNLPKSGAAGTVIEVSPESCRIAAALASRLAQAPGAALIIDYGHAETAAGDTLQAVRGHKFADPLANPGEADLTAHVDFAALARAARARGAEIHGPVSQGRFLIALGIAQRAERLKAGATPALRDAIEAALKRLIAPSEMGNLFKVMGLSQAGGPALPGFAP